MLKKCFDRDNLLKSLQVLMIVLNISLLGISGYFSIEDQKDTKFGLQGALINSKFVYYSDLMLDCTLANYCNELEDFDRSGKILITFICIDIILLISAIIMNLVLTYCVKEIIKYKEKVAGRVKFGLKILTFHVNLLFLHPIIINLGFLLWIAVSKLTKFSHKIVLHEGLIVLIVQSFCSLLALAFNAWIISSTKRRNVRMMRGTHYKNEDLSVSI